MPSDRDVRRIAQQRMVEAMARHSSYLHRAATAQVNEMREAVDKLGAELARSLSDRLDNLSPAELQAFAQGRYHTDRLKGLRKTIDTWAATLGTQIDTLAKAGFEELAGHEAEYARRMLGEVLEDDLPKAPTAAAAYGAAMRSPVLGEMVDEMLSAIPERTRQQVYSAVRQGIAQGQTNAEIVRALRGTRALQYRDGILQQTRNSVERVVRTGRNHVSNVAYEETYAALGVEELVWTATLDGRTCLVAGSLIDTPSGKRPIEEIAAGDMVMGGSGSPRRVSGTLESTAKRLCRVRLSSGEAVTCTQDHMFWTKRGWVEAQDLRAGDSLPDKL